MPSPLATDGPVTLTARQRARAEVTAEIVQAARLQLAAEGAASISLRAIARDLGMPSSAIHRYFATREALITRLIVEAYDSIGAATEESQQGVATDDLMGRFGAACRAIRGWSVAHPHEYSLVFGSPIPDYEAPEETVQSAARVPGVLGAIMLDAVKRRTRGPRREVPLSDAGRRALTPALELFAHEVPAERMQAGLMVWMGIFGTLSFELYGHHYGAIGQNPEDREAYFESCIAAWAQQLGIS